MMVFFKENSIRKELSYHQIPETHIDVIWRVIKKLKKDYKQYKTIKIAIQN